MAVTLNQIFELKCLSELEDVSSVALYVGLLAIPLCLLTPVPQYYKLYKRGSAAGFSSMMLLIGNIGRSLNVINLLILHYDQVRWMLTLAGALFPYPDCSGFIDL
uniref:PQ-loop repeat-containing protein 1 n=1 Tax=Rhodosorus marinus TaxID=101924 RepID=A0A7S3E778_9RHOD|mmetsp:Transcript_11080/g.46252  ORF Transcript_11080/g.46252 Transcript_11080/m.46252 type:complete len:105 (+) Transcript_11080:384-698(+)